MYYYIELFFGIGILVLGLVMVINPKGATKKELHDDKNAVAGTRKNGSSDHRRCLNCGCDIFLSH